MKFLIAQMEHETNTFSPVPTPWKSFGPNGPYLGDEVVQAMSGTKTPIGAFIELANKVNADISTPVAGLALPSGPVDLQAYERICDLICSAAKLGCDAIFLDLHGAMVVKNGPLDGEGNLLHRLKDINPEVPIAVSLDLHANVTDLMVNNCDVIAGYKTYPHIDMFETGFLAGSILIDALKGKIKPVMVWKNSPILAHTLKMDTDKGAMREYVGLAKKLETGEVLAASAFGGFPMADIPSAGMSSVVVTNGDKELGASTCNKIMNFAWENRTRFIWRDIPLKTALSKAAKFEKGPVLLIDHSDNCASGGTQDTMDVLKSALDYNLEQIGVGPVRDPEAVKTLIQAGKGNEVSLEIGGKIDMPAIKKKGEPLQLTGFVKNITSGEYIVTGPQFTGMKMFMGNTVLFETDRAEIVITERLQEPWDLGVFTSVGLNPTKKRYLILKSRMYFKPIFSAMATEIIYCDGSGVTSSDWKLFDYKNVRRPIYPLDESPWN